MQIKTTDGDKNVASQAVGGSALGLAIPGTLAFLNQLGGGILGGARQGGVTECTDTRYIASLQSELAREKSERYADKVGLEVYTASNNNYKELAGFIAELDKKIAVDKQSTVDNFAFLNNRIDTTKNEIMCYCNSTFVPGKLVMPLDNICPEAMQRYNSWIAPTAPTSQTAKA